MKPVRYSCHPRRSRRGIPAHRHSQHGHPTAGTCSTFHVGVSAVPETTSSRSGPPQPGKSAFCRRVFVSLTRSPGRRTAVPSSRSGLRRRKRGIFRIDAETSEITKLAGEGLAPKLCPDGKTLVFVTDGGQSSGNATSTPVRSRKLSKQGRMAYDLSPDGREVVFQVDGAVKTVSLNGGEPRELFRGLAKTLRAEVDEGRPLHHRPGTRYREQ